MEPTSTIIGALQYAAVDVSGNVGLAAVAGVGVGIVIYGIKRVWGAFRSM